MKNSVKLEKLLNKKIPDDYKEFIDKEGFISKNGVEIYGYSPNIDIDKIPCVIGATNLYKKLFPLNDDELVIAFDYLYNTPILLNISNGNIYKINNNNKRNLLFNNFKEFYNEFTKNV